MNQRKKEAYEQDRHLHPDIARLYALYGSCGDIERARRGY